MEIHLALPYLVTIKVLYILQRIQCIMREQSTLMSRYHYIRDVVAEGDLKVCKISTHDYPANMMTKPVPTNKFELCTVLVGISH